MSLPLVWDMDKTSHNSNTRREGDTDYDGWKHLIPFRKKSRYVIFQNILLPCMQLIKLVN